MFLSRSGVGVYSAEAGAESESKISDSVHLCSRSNRQQLAQFTLSRDNRLPSRDERTVKFFSPSPVLIRWNWIRSSPDPQNFWKSSVRSRPDPPMKNHIFLFCLMRQKNYWRILPLAKYN